MVTQKGSQKTMNMRVSPNFIQMLKKEARYGESLEQVARRLILSKQLKQETKDALPSEYEEKLNRPKKERKR